VLGHRLPSSFAGTTVPDARLPGAVRSGFGHGTVGPEFRFTGSPVLAGTPDERVCPGTRSRRRRDRSSCVHRRETGREPRGSRRRFRDGVRDGGCRTNALPHPRADGVAETAQPVEKLPGRLLRAGSMARGGSVSGQIGASDASRAPPQAFAPTFSTGCAVSATKMGPCWLPNACLRSEQVGVGPCLTLGPERHHLDPWFILPIRPRHQYNPRNHQRRKQGSRGPTGRSP
jgi:hypothetical protein